MTPEVLKARAALLDADARRFLDSMRQKNQPPPYTFGPQEARMLVKAGNPLICAPGPAMAETRDLYIPGGPGQLPARMYVPMTAGRSRSLLVYFHGGGFVYCDIETHDGICRSLAHASGCSVVSVGYRQAPEDQFPAAITDALDATRWVMAHARDLGVGEGRVAVGGDSAGGNLAAGAAQTIPGLAAQILFYPLLDFTYTRASHVLNGAGYILTREGLSWFRDQYLPIESDWRDVRASPGLAQTLSGLPPAFVLSAGFDPLRDDAEDYARRLVDAGVRTHLRAFPGQIHGFAMMSRVMSAADVVVAEAGKWLRETLG